MKTPLTYYGGKQKLSSMIIKLLPGHKNYVESFVGGGAVFFAKPPSEIEVINDTNRELINFYQVAQQDFVALEKLVKISLHSRSLFRDASVVYNNPHMFSTVKRAWAVWVLLAMGFAGKMDSSFGYDLKRNTTTKKVSNKREMFSEELAVRLQNVNIERDDAVKVILRHDTPETLHYVDPPYVNSNCGHYDGYSWNDFQELLETLSSIKGYFLLSSYPSEMLDDFRAKNGWFQKTKEFGVSVSVEKKNQKRKIEVLTANYDLDKPPGKINLI